MKTIVNKLCSKRRTLGMAILAASLHFAPTVSAQSVGDLAGFDEDAYYASGAQDEVPAGTGDYYADQDTFDNETADQDAEQIADQDAVIQQTAGTFIGDQPAFETADDVAPIDYLDAAPIGEQVNYLGDMPAETIGSGYDRPVAQGSISDGIEAVGFLDNLRQHAGDHGCESGGCGDGASHAVGCDLMPMTGGCDSFGCDSIDTGKSLGSRKGWATVEALLWFVEDRETAPLAIEFDDAVLNLPEAPISSLDSFDSGLAAGFRADAGFWLGDNVGVGGRFTQVFDGSESGQFTPTSADNGTGIPFFSLLGGATGPDILLANTTTDANGQISTGTIDFEEEIDFWMAEAYGRIRLSKAKHYSIDLLGGYTHLELDNQLGITLDRVLTDTSVVPVPGTTQQFNEQFDTENVFDGGQIGFETVITHGRWMVRSLTKVHLGNMRQSVSLQSSGVETQPGFGPTAQAGGLFSAAGTTTAERDVFAFIPEANFKLGYRVTDRAYFTAGYSFIYVDNIALAGGSIPTALTPGFAGGPALTPAINDDSLYIHGLDLGVVLDF